MSSPFSQIVPTHKHKDFHLRYGHPLPFGASMVRGGVNFSIFSVHATSCVLVLYKRGEPEPWEEIPFPDEFKIGDVFAMTVFGLDCRQFDYGFRLDGPHDPAAGHRFNFDQVLLDPYAREISGMPLWRPTRDHAIPHLRCRVPTEDFDWHHDRPLNLPESELVIYEMHVRGFTQHESSGVRARGTFDGMREKIGYLKELGVNCVELMPIFEFNERENTRTNPLTGETLCNYWGYSTIGFFAPKAAYAASGPTGGECNELRYLIKELHSAGIKVLLDVVFNHTAELGDDGPTYSFRGIDNSTYYMLNKDGSYANFTGCGNTVNCNHPAVRQVVIDSLRHWAADYHIDGFRFDLASVLGRAQDGSPLSNPPLLEFLAHDPVLANCDLIAEAWDAGGLYQVGSFPAFGRWMEWNGKYRDAARRFLRRDSGVVAEMVQRILGSPDLYAASGRKPTASVNFITCHDGFTLRDLVCYSRKHNLENGENNNDGANDNWSCNYGVEGETDDPAINALRLRQQKNAMALLMVSQGVPMFFMGDECGRSQRGNNNAYCHDEPWNWFDWSLTEKNRELLRFTQQMIAFRRANPALRRSEFLTGHDTVGSGYPDISWHGVIPWKPDWTPSSHTIAFMLCGRHAVAAGGSPDFIYCVFNMYVEPLTFMMPHLPKGYRWFKFADTAAPSPNDITQPGQETLLSSQDKIQVMDRSSVILVGRLVS